MKHRREGAGSGKRLTGEVASGGIACGRALHCSCAKRVVVSRRDLREEEIAGEMRRFEVAVEEVERELRGIASRVRSDLGEKDARIFEAQICFLRDPALRELVNRICCGKRVNVEAAVEEGIRRQIGALERMRDPRFRERSPDLRDVGRRLLEKLAADGPVDPGRFPEGTILVTGEMLPSAIAQLGDRGVCGLIVEKGGRTSHASILARALDLPLLVRVEGATREIRPGERVILDGGKGEVIVDPDEATWKSYRRREEERAADEERLRTLIHLPTVTRDGVAVKLAANLGLPADVNRAVALKADGVGLYRTEFAFLARDHLLGEEEQFDIYRSAAARIAPGDLVIRALDIGSDKPLPFLNLPPEENPALGRRGMRLLLARPDILLPQLRAILRVAAIHPVSLLFPMIDGIDPLRAAKAAVETAKAELRAAGKPFAEHLPIGVMIETPSSAVVMEDLAEEASFFSVGTNDLVQYFLAADRTSEAMASACEPMHPAILRVLAKLAAVARTAGKPIGLCGEIAGDERYLPLLLGLGFRGFSVTPRRLLAVKKAIRSADCADCETLARDVLAMRTVAEIRARVSVDSRRGGC